MNDGQVAIHTGQDVKGHQSRESGVKDVIPSFRHPLDFSVDATEEEGGRKKSVQLHGRHVVGEHVGVTRTVRGPPPPPPPSLVNQVEDEDGKRQEYEESGEDESRKYGQRSSEVQTVEKGEADGGVGADEHVCLDGSPEVDKQKNLNHKTHFICCMVSHKSGSTPVTFQRTFVGKTLSFFQQCLLQPEQDRSCCPSFDHFYGYYINSYTLLP